jgi:hypothetical protein
MKKSIVAIVGIFLAVSCTHAKQIESGWHMYGFASDVNLSSVLADKLEITAVWSYDSSSKHWKLYTPNGVDVSSYDNIDPLEVVPLGTGVWTYNASTSSIDINDTLSNATYSLQRELANIVASSADGLGATGSAASGAKDTIGGTIGATGLGRVLYYEIPSFSQSSDESALLADIPTPVGSAKASIKFFNGSTPIVPAMNVLDQSGVAYGLTGTNGFETVGYNLGVFFQNLSPSTPNESFVDIVTQVTTMKSAPLFFVVGDQDFQSYFASFPSNEQSANDANWTKLGNDYLNLAGDIYGSNFKNLSPDFSRISSELAVSFDTPLNVAGLSVTLPPLKTSVNVDKYMSNAVNFTFTSDGNGTVNIPDFTVNMQNIELNVTYSATNVNVLGQYDLEVKDGNDTYRATPTFGVDGCHGAEIYKNGETTPVARIKLLDDGLYIVDENNDPIEKVR